MRKATPSLFLAACLSLPAGLAAQGPVLVPAAAAQPDGDHDSFALLWGSASGTNRGRSLSLYPVAEVGLGTGTITGLAFRRATDLAVPNLATTVQMTIELSVSPLAANAANATFDANHGSNRMVVFQGQVSVPAAPAVAWPAPFLPPITFQTPFPYDGSVGNSLVVDIRVAGSSSHQPWYVATRTVGYGTGVAQLVQNTCLTSGGDPSGAYGYQQFEPYPGGTFSLSYLGYARKQSFQFSVLMIGMNGPGGSFGGVALPVPLNTLGLPAAPTCQLAVSPDIVVAMNYLPGSSGNPGVIGYGPVNLPNIAGLTGQSFFTQALSIDYENSMPAPLFFPSMTQRWTFGTGFLPNCSQVTRANDGVVPDATGTLAAHTAPVLQLQLQ